MADSRWDILQRLFEELLPLDRAARAARLQTLAPGDAPLREQLEGLLRAAEAPANPLDTPLAVSSAAASTLAGDGPFRAGMRVGPYTLVRLVGEGGMGWVWLAERADGALTRTVALKLPKWTWSLPDLTARLARERDILASLEHANIARLYDAGVDDAGRPYLAMEYVDGQPIDAYCREHALSLEARLQVLLQVAHAVAYAHSRLVVHRDLKPSNIVVAADGSVRLLDFGIATLLDTSATTRPAVTSPGTRIFTLQYAAPEQITGGPIGTPTDVYALGLVLYELLTGAAPYRSAKMSAAALEEAIVAGDTRLASAAATDRTVARRLRGDLDAILNKALKPDPAERYASVHAFAEDLERFLKHETVSARPDSAAYRLRTFARRHRPGIAAAALVLVTLTGATIYSARQAAIADREARTATAIKDFLLEVFQQASAKASLKAEPQNLRVIDVIDEGRGRLLTSLDGQPDVQMAIIAVLGDIYELLDATGKASALYEQGLPIAERAFGPGNPHTPFLLGGMANAAMFAGDWDTAATRVAAADAAFTAAGDHESRYYARVLKIRGSLARRRGPDGLREAVALLDQAATLFKTRYPDDVDHAGTYMFLAQAHMALEQTHEALAAADASVAAAAMLPAEDTMSRASAYSLRASVLDRLGESTRAEPDYAQASAGYLASVGAGHFFYLQNENLHGLALQMLGRRAEALAMLESSAAGVSRVRPATNTEMNTMHRMAVAYEHDGQPAKALAAVTRGLALARAKTPGTTPALLSALLLDEARARLQMGEADAATARAREAVDTARAAQALSPQIEADAALVEAEAALAGPEPGAALPLTQRAVALSAGDAFAAQVRRARALWLESLAGADAVTAATRAREALALLDALPPPGDPFVRVNVLDQQGRLACRAGDATAGRAALQRALSERQRLEDGASPRVAATLQALATCAGRG